MVEYCECDYSKNISTLRLCLTTHSTGARISRSLIVNLTVSAVRRARSIRALGACVVVSVEDKRVQKEPSSMSKYEEGKEIPERVVSFFYRNLPLVAYVLGVKVLDAFMPWPLAIGVAGILGLGLLGYWIPEKSERRFREHFGLVVLLSVALAAIAYLMVWLGWVRDK